MKAPDKIYIGRYNYGALLSDWTEQPRKFAFGENICYIRKDALLERLTHAKEFREKHCSGPNKVADYIAPIDALIKIINEL